jgi:hypothetical protein
MYRAFESGIKSSNMAVTRVVLGLLTLLAPSIKALRVTPGSPCTNVCAPATNTTSSEIVCLDAQYNTTTVGTKFQSCITCALQSNFQDAKTRETDVDWALCMDEKVPGGRRRC